MLSAALELVDSEGLDALTMRRLGQELGRDPMSLYRYAENRAALLDGVSELVLNELAIIPDDPDWQAQLRRIAHDLRDCWPSGTPTSCRCSSPAPCPRPWACGRWGPCGRWSKSCPC